jgi:hypothetical protein
MKQVMNMSNDLRLLEAFDFYKNLKLLQKFNFPFLLRSFCCLAHEQKLLN